MCEIENKIFSWLKLKLINLSKFNIALLVSNILSLSLFMLFGLFTHGKNVVSNDWFWNHIFTVLWALLAILVTALTFVLSIYLPPILKELKDLSIGINKSIRHKLIKNNPISLNIFQMVISIGMIAFLVLELFCLSVTISDKSSPLWITVLVIIYAVITLCFWVMSIWELALIDYDNYINDCLLLLPIDSKNQRSYYTIIERQLHNHLANNDVYRFNDDLIQIAKFIANDKLHKFIYCEDYCIKLFFKSNNEAQYLKNMKYTYDLSIQRYSFSKEPTTSNDLGLPEEQITKFQSFLFSSNSTLLRDFLVNVVQTHVELEKSSQYELIDYYLWVLDNLCANNDDYSFTFALDITQNFKSGKDARKFLLDAMKIALYRQNNGAAHGLYRGYLLFLERYGIDSYIELKKNDGSKAWLFSDLIYLTVISLILDPKIYFESFNQFIYVTTINCAKSEGILLEWVAFICCHNRIAQSKITEKDFSTVYPETSVFDLIPEELSRLLRQILDNNPIEILKSDAYTFQFTRAIDNRDFWNNDRISETLYNSILREVLNGK
ncbi:MAG: hypothetical protein K2Q03_09100 [Sphingobacteriaceae bacterium]|nr:hypothetical protein [Sphingobacteriaceae bacterium]